MTMLDTSTLVGLIRGDQTALRQSAEAAKRTETPAPTLRQRVASLFTPAEQPRIDHRGRFIAAIDDAIDAANAAHIAPHVVAGILAGVAQQIRARIAMTAPLDRAL